MTTRKSAKPKQPPASRLVLFASKARAEHEYTFVVNLTADLVEAILDAYEDAEEDEYGAVLKLGGALYDNEGRLSGKVYLREEEEEEEAPKRKTTKRRKPDDDEDEEEEEAPTKSRKRRAIR
jgi:hypothetical protein